MPSTYAHYRMGQQVRAAVGDRERNIIEKYPELFLIGLHGPDILFYYHALSSNPVNRLGFGMHDRPGMEFFAHAAEVIQKQEDRTAYLSYIYGFICHFAMDVTCHGYIDEKMSASGLSHSEIETEFDKKLMEMDDLNPFTYNVTGHIVPSLKNAEVIHKFFEGITTLQVQKALEGMINDLNLLASSSRAMRSLIFSVFRISGKYKELRGLVVNEKGNPLCEDSNKRLLYLYEEARKLAVQLIGEYSDYVRGRDSLNGIYIYTFGSQLPGSEETAI